MRGARRAVHLPLPSPTTSTTKAGSTAYMHPLERIPYDIWCIILELVCADGGTAGCSLARTSRTFRALSAPTRFHSLALTSVTQVKGFLICLERIRRFDGEHPPPPSSCRLAPAATAAGDCRSQEIGTHSAPLIHHIFLSFIPPTCDAPQRAFRKCRGRRSKPSGSDSRSFPDIAGSRSYSVAGSYSTTSSRGPGHVATAPVVIKSDCARKAISKRDRSSDAQRSRSLVTAARTRGGSRIFA